MARLHSKKPSSSLPTPTKPNGLNVDIQLLCSIRKSRFWSSKPSQPTEVLIFSSFFRIIFKKVAKLMGGKVRLMLSGGAPLSPDTHEQIKLCLCVDVIQGYGLTETTSGATVMDGKWITNQRHVDIKN